MILKMCTRKNLMADRKIRGQRKNLDFDFVKKLRLDKILKESSLKIKKGHHDYEKVLLRS